MQDQDKINKQAIFLLKRKMLASGMYGEVNRTILLLEDKSFWQLFNEKCKKAGPIETPSLQETIFATAFNYIELLCIRTKSDTSRVFTKVRNLLLSDELMRKSIVENFFKALQSLGVLDEFIEEFVRLRRWQVPECDKLLAVKKHLIQVVKNGPYPTSKDLCYAFSSTNVSFPWTYSKNGVSYWMAIEQALIHQVSKKNEAR